MAAPTPSPASNDQKLPSLGLDASEISFGRTTEPGSEFYAETSSTYNRRSPTTYRIQKYGTRPDVRRRNEPSHISGESLSDVTSNMPVLAFDINGDQLTNFYVDTAQSSETIDSAFALAGRLLKKDYPDRFYRIQGQPLGWNARDELLAARVAWTEEMRDAFLVQIEGTRLTGVRWTDVLESILKRVNRVLADQDDRRVPFDRFNIQIPSNNIKILARVIEKRTRCPGKGIFNPKPDELEPDLIKEVADAIRSKYSEDRMRSNNP
jgi:hypothetical protein